MQRPTPATHRGRRTRLHTVALAIVFGLLAVIATGPRQPRAHAAPVNVVESFPAIP